MCVKKGELKACPFCGGKPRVFVCDGSGSYYSNVGTVVYYGRQMTHLLIMCDKCHIRTQPYLTERGVFNAWNRRADNEQKAD